MTTLPPSKVKPHPESALEKIAYASVASIPTQEPNDQYRLGYSVWKYITERKGTLRNAVKAAGARVLIPEQDVLRIIAENLKKSGISAE